MTVPRALSSRPFRQTGLVHGLRTGPGLRLWESGGKAALASSPCSRVGDGNLKQAEGPVASQLSGQVQEGGVFGDHFYM